ncbi:hypothetical protein DUNSADRAFT_411 [Dunaliella salina]|uniref:ABCF3 PWI-like helical bundle domain-containing protein n=1 Tax=Dunaliella salina TaxID=3046 RepID=A0ABQ7FYY9_DUNSA|nr:hypothetical protein DUNSADRAFT_411 [Dunaliella salina]|eukprot:KAF5827579.1 hypothetical protein DUNSADRAFT_411 [Dunaliella salina]
MGDNIRKEVTALFSGKGDETIVDYVCGILEDDDFDLGDGEGDQVFEAIGPFLVDGGCCKDEAEAQSACKTLAHKLSGKAASQQPTMRALESGPVQLASADNKALLYDENQSASARQAAAEKEAAASLPQVSEKDKQRMEKLKAKEEAAARAAFEVRASCLQGMPAALQNGKQWQHPLAKDAVEVRPQPEGHAFEVRLQPCKHGKQWQLLVAKDNVGLIEAAAQAAMV